MFEFNSGDLASGLSSWGVLVAAWLLQRYLPLSSAIDPIAFFRFVCQRMAKKVLPEKLDKQQNFISGSLALIALVLPTLIIILLISKVAYYPLILDILLLYICFQFSAIERASKQISDALKQHKKQLAKALLSPHVLRDTDSLSEIGISKATIEMFSLRLMYQQVTCIFCFILFGPIATLAYRLCYEAQQSWNPKYPKFRHFAWLASALSAAVQYVPVRIFSLLLLLVSINKHSIGYLTFLCAPRMMFASNGGFILATASCVIHRNMSGAVKYQQKKVMRQKFIRHGEPANSDIKDFIGICSATVLLYLGLLLPLSYALYS